MNLTEKRLRNIIISEVRRALNEGISARGVMNAISEKVDELMNTRKARVVFGDGPDSSFDMYLKDSASNPGAEVVCVKYRGRTACSNLRGADSAKFICNAAYNAFMEAYLNLPK